MDSEIFELKPVDGKKSFYGKALVKLNADGSKTLYSYSTKIMTKNVDGSFTKHWDGWSATTGRHIAAFSGLNKAEYEQLA